MRFVAAGWSGAAKGEQRHLWIAEVDGGSLHVDRLAPYSRLQAAERLIEVAAADSEVIVGLDFGFSLPAWFLDDHGIESAPDLWAGADRLEGWLASCAPPFWGRPGKRRPDLAPERHWRRTEMATVPRPKSVFQIGGAGSVGTASLRGMPILDRLHRGGFAIWPFDPPRFPLVLEVWPRLAMGSVIKSRVEARRSWLRSDRRAFALPPGVMALAEGSDDAFDATVAALALAGDFHGGPPMVNDITVRREGWIWGVPLVGS
jgi:Protein of unknown function (DUF429)